MTTSSIPLLLALLAIAVAQTVPAVTQVEGLEISTVSLANLNHSDSQIYIHNWKSKFTFSPQTALGNAFLTQPSWVSSKTTSP